jgi:2-isopropylmalate synthase
VVIEWRDGDGTWGTVGVSENVVEASWQALADAVEYKLFKDEEAVCDERNGSDDRLTYR